MRDQAESGAVLTFPRIFREEIACAALDERPQMAQAARVSGRMTFGYPGPPARPAAFLAPRRRLLRLGTPGGRPAPKISQGKTPSGRCAGLAGRPASASSITGGTGGCAPGTTARAARGPLWAAVLSAQQLRQLGEVRRHAAGLVAGQPVGCRAALRRSDMSGIRRRSAGRRAAATDTAGFAKTAAIFRNWQFYFDIFLQVAANLPGPHVRRWPGEGQSSFDASFATDVCSLRVLGRR